MIVEDERLISLMETRMVAEAGHQVVGCFLSAEAALDSMEGHRPDVVIMDIRLKGRMDGIEAAGRIRERGKTAIIFASAFSDDQTRSRAEATNPIGFLAKPISSEALRELLSKADRLIRSRE